MRKLTLAKVFRLTPRAVLSLKELAKRKGVSQVAIIEMLIQYEWEREKRRKPPK
jgi:hypothetical protein